MVVARPFSVALTAVVLLLAFLGGCLRPDYDPGVTAADFIAGIDNEWLPLVPGARWVYEAATDEGLERIEVVVLPDTRDIEGVTATVVRDTVTLDGRLVEDTYDWFAEDRAGNVWYLGEDSCEFDAAERCVDRSGSWEWGVDGALPGIVMWADPVANGTAYFQEFYWREAVDEAAVIDAGRNVTVPAGTWEDTITTREWTRLDRTVEEEATYVRGIGPILKEVTKGSETGQAEQLIEFFIPPMG